jgi:hypothetical protein
MQTMVLSYTIAVEPSGTPGKVTATSSDGHTFTPGTPLLNGARYWLQLGADPAETITIAWSSGPGHCATLRPILINRRR